MSTLQPIANKRIRTAAEAQTPLAVPPPIDYDANIKWLSTPQNKLYEESCRKGDAESIKDAKKRIIKIKVKRQGYLQTFQDLLKFPEGSEAHAMFKELDQLEEEEMLHTRLSAQETIGLFVTLSPEPGTVTVHQIHAAMEKLSKKKGITLMLWSLENYGVKGEHPHSHAVILLDKTVQQGERARMTRAIQSSLKDFRTKSDAFLQIKCLSQKNYNKKVDYVKGKKYDKVKLEKVQLDKVWRKEQDLEDWYIYPPKQELID